MYEHNGMSRMKIHITQATDATHCTAVINYDILEYSKALF